MASRNYELRIQPFTHFTTVYCCILFALPDIFLPSGGCRVERRCCVNNQCQGVLLVWMIVWQGPIVLAVCAGRGCLDIFSLIYLFSSLSPSLWETARYRLTYCLKGPLNPKQPTIYLPITTVTVTFYTPGPTSLLVVGLLLRYHQPSNQCF